MRACFQKVPVMARVPYMMSTDIKSTPENLSIMSWRIKAEPCILTKAKCGNISVRYTTIVQMEMEEPIVK